PRGRLERGSSSQPEKSLSKHVLGFGGSNPQPTIQGTGVGERRQQLLAFALHKPAHEPVFVSSSTALTQIG
ncbi:MAG: hypothetical protein ACPG40_13485, partial [Alphaproteobacteria bacterium]